MASPLFLSSLMLFLFLRLLSNSLFSQFVELLSHIILSLSLSVQTEISLLLLALELSHLFPSCAFCWFFPPNRAGHWFSQPSDSHSHSIFPAFIHPPSPELYLNPPESIVLMMSLHLYLTWILPLICPSCTNMQRYLCLPRQTETKPRVCVY